MLRTYCHNQHTTWGKWLENIEYWLNQTTHTSTGFTPWEIIKNKSPNRLITNYISFPKQPQPMNNQIIELVKHRLRDSAEKRKKKNDSNKRFIKYMVGQKS